MVFAREKKINGKKYYYLVKNYKVNGKTKQKNLKYLGVVMPNSKQLEQIKSEFTEKKVEKIVRSGLKYLKYKLEFEDLNKVEELKKQFTKNINSLSQISREQLSLRFKTGYTYHSCSIEGNTLSRYQVDMILNKQESIGGKRLIEIKEIQNHNNAIEYMLSEQGDLTQDFIKRLHKVLMEGMKELKEKSIYEDYEVGFIEGEYRRDMRFIQGADFIPVIPEGVECEMKKLISFYNAHKYTIHPLELASEIHYQFVVIHPFADGNGRMGRLLMNFILNRGGYPMIDISVKNRESYLHSLASGDTKILSQFIISEFERYIVELFKDKEEV